MNLAIIKKRPLFTLCLGVTVLLLIGAGAVSFLSERQYALQVRAMDAVTTRLQQLCHRDPFPAQANVRVEAENLKDVVDRYNELNELLRTGQVDLQPMKAVDFMQFREKFLHRLRGRLQNARIKFPEKYAFSFDKYEGGQLPNLSDVPRLVQQLKIIEALCDILQEAGITELVAIERDNFEQAAQGTDASAGRRGAPPPGAAVNTPDGEKMVSSQHFKISVRARENAVIDMLNLLASRPMFMVVTWIEMSNPNQEYSSGGPVAAPVPAAGASTPGVPAPAVSDPSARERQIVLGREELDVKLDLDVYQFASSLAFKEDGKK